MRQFPDVTHGVPSNVLSREAGRRNLVTRRDYFFGGQSIYWYSTEYDLLNRPTNATDSVSLMREWLYNNRSELAAATIGMNQYGYDYDTIGNRLWSAANVATNEYAANALNQYTSVGGSAPDAPQTTFVYDADGNMTRDGRFLYSYDAENRLRAVTSRSMTNGALRVLNAYDHRNRRIGVAPDTPEPEIVAHLFRLYAEKTAGAAATGKMPVVPVQRTRCPLSQ